MGALGMPGQGELHEEFVGVPPELLKVGAHAGGTFYELSAFYDAIRRSPSTEGAPVAEVDVIQGVVAVAIGLAAQLSIEQGRPVMLWDFLQEHAAFRSTYFGLFDSKA